MKSLKNVSGILFGVFISLFLVFGTVQANSSVQQDSTKNKKMSRMDHSRMQQQGSMKGMKSDMQKMHKNMTSMKMTGDPDYDFAQMMIEHHKGAIDMSKKELKQGKDQEVKSMAQKVIDDQTKEMKELQAFTKKNKPSKAMKGEETGSAEKDMMSKINDDQKEMQDMQMKGDQDQDYVSMLIMHHKQAVDMSKDYLDNAKNDRLKQMAQKMIDENKDQIDKLENWQDKHK